MSSGFAGGFGSGSRNVSEAPGGDITPAGAGTATHTHSVRAVTVHPPSMKSYDHEKKT